MSQSKLMAVVQLPGILDLPTKVRWHFAKAVIAEMEGNGATAESELNLAVEVEASLAAVTSMGKT